MSAVAGFGLLLTASGWGVEVRKLEVTEREGGYHAEAQAHLDASAAAIWRLLSDFAKFPEISPAIGQVQLLGPAGDHAWRVRTQALACVLWFCRSLQQVQRVWLVAPSDVWAEADPQESDFQAGYAHWRVQSGGSGTELEFSAFLVPAFGVPPLVGPWLVKRALKSEMSASLVNLERLAQEAIQ